MTRMTTERFFGGIEGRIENLKMFLEFVSNESPVEHDMIEWIRDNTDADSDDTIKRNIRFLETIELIIGSKRSII